MRKPDPRFDHNFDAITCRLLVGQRTHLEQLAKKMATATQLPVRVSDVTRLALDLGMKQLDKQYK